MNMTLQTLIPAFVVCATSLAAEPNPAIEANTNFACDLYRQLAEEKEGNNLGGFKLLAQRRVVNGQEL